MKEQIVTYKNCDFRCYLKTIRTKSGTPSDRVYCGKVNPKCKFEEEAPPYKISQQTAARQRALLDMEDLVRYIKPFPPALTTAQIFGSKFFQKRQGGKDKEKHVMMGRKYIGTPTTAILKTFRPDITKQLEKLEGKYHFQTPGSDEYEDFKSHYDEAVSWPSTEIEWGLVGYIPSEYADVTKFAAENVDVAIFVSCSKGKIARVNARYVHVIEDVNNDCRYYSGGPEAIMAVLCGDERVMATMPMKMLLSSEEQLALADLLC